MAASSSSGARAKRDIALSQPQEEHVGRMKDILRFHHVVNDTTNTGYGKTVCALAVVADRGSRFLTFGKANLSDNWFNETSQYNLPPYGGFIGYEKSAHARDDLAGEFTQRLRDGTIVTRYLLRVNRVQKGDSWVIQSYTPTEHLVKFFSAPSVYDVGNPNRSPIVIFDEMQGFKNENTATNKMVRAIGRAIREHPEWNAKMINLSATPISDIPNAVAMCRAFGYIRHPKLFIKTKNRDGSYDVSTAGLGDLVEDMRDMLSRRSSYIAAARRRDLTTLEDVPLEDFERLLLRSGYDDRNYNFDSFGGRDQPKPSTLIYAIYTGFIVKSLASSVESMSIPIMSYRGFFGITDDDDRKLIMTATQLIQDVINNSNDVNKKLTNQEIANLGLIRSTGSGTTQNYQGKIFQALHMLEEAFVYDIVRLALEKLRKNPNSKQIICFNLINKPRGNSRGFPGTLQMIRRYLNEAGIPDHDIVTWAGKDIYDKTQSIPKRIEAKKRWERDPNVHFLLGQQDAMKEGNNFHDTSVGGLYKRFMWIIPDYDLLKMHQLAGRIFRAGATSVGECYYFFPRNAAILTGLISALDTKSGITRSSRNDKGAHLTKYPGELDRYIEPFTNNKGLEVGGFLDESVYGRGGTFQGKVRDVEVPIQAIIPALERGDPIRFIEQKILEPDQEMIDIINGYMTLAPEDIPDVVDLDEIDFENADTGFLSPAEQAEDAGPDGDLNDLPEEDVDWGSEFL